MNYFRFLIFLMVTINAQAIAADDWLPSNVENALVQQLAERLSEAGFEGDSEPQRVQGATRAIGDMRNYLEQIGETGILEKAPKFDLVSLPVARQKYLDAMASFNMCNLVLLLQHMERADRDQNSRITAAVGLSAVTLAIIYLRQPFAAGGGKPQDIEAFLTSDEMEPASRLIQTQEAVRQHVEERCSPFIVQFLENVSMGS